MRNLIALTTISMLLSATTVLADDLVVKFADPAWTGSKIPNGQHCQKFGGQGATPPLTVSGIPANANAIVVEFNDKSFSALSYDGGHGKIGFMIEPGVGEVTLPAVPGGTDSLPGGTWLVKKNRATGAWYSAGYLPPCSGGRGNTYAAEVYAVVKKGDDYEEIAEGEITLGLY